MKKTDFLNNEQVKSFISYLIDKWSQETVFDAGKIQYSNISDSLSKYKWSFNVSNEPLFVNSFSNRDIVTKGETFIESQQILDLLKESLEYAYFQKNEEKLFFTLRAILAWGGPRTLGSETRGNLKYLLFLKEGKHISETPLIDSLHEIKQHWNSINNDEIDINTEVSFRSNSGFTKIMALFLHDFIIYDSRVGAAFTHFLSKKFGKDVPDNLKLFLPNGSEKKSVYTSNSNPNIFKSTRQDDLKHFSSNVKTSLIVKEIVKGINLLPRIEKINSREFEAALFMIGADVSEGRM